jgi:hypothetical protein
MFSLLVRPIWQNSELIWGQKFPNVLLSAVTPFVTLGEISSVENIPVLPYYEYITKHYIKFNSRVKAAEA